ncbi:D-threo-aldose 1-dehydrogenase [Sphingobium sp. AP50]|uniref:aldo/keto reductase n=1 Tax=Sphingobium sp. AP50 TaxID=1884369 RepID=UPI0008C5E67F|nr:aldo/keto reductase [Sphingobium sp. AP50]SEJ88439.1 D-threo-aldose 1-dehydrogenase [Sphingobium sp. AP50]
MIPFPTLGMGTAPIGNLYRVVSDTEARATLDAAWDVGIRYYDSAPHYGFGLAERRLGAMLAERDPAGEAVVSTKVGRLLVPTDAQGERHGFVDADPFEPVFDYGYDAILHAFDGSRARLGRDRIDLLLAHDLGRVTHGEAHADHLRAFLNGGYRAMRDLRDAGAVGAIGIGVNEVAICDELLDHVELDMILLAGRYTLLDRSAERLLARCAELGVRVIVGGPYNSGILARDLKGPLHFDYAVPSAEILGKAQRLSDTCGQYDVPLPVAALQFPLRHPAVVSVIPGLVGADQVADTMARMAVPLPDALWPALDASLKENAMLQDDARLILLHPNDNVLICVRAIEAGDILPSSGGTIPAREGIAIGHKVARTALCAGDKIIKYGAPIGSMTADAATGEWVHMHNMKSDYISSHTRTALEQGA